MKIYRTRYLARKHAFSNQKTIKVDGGFVNMTFDQWHIWRKQK